MLKQSITIELPWPPSVNSYYRRRGHTYFISQKGVQYRREVCLLCHKYRHTFSDTERISITIEAYPPDKRRRDLDNLLKSLQDSLEHAKVFKDDSQIDKLIITRQPEKLSKVVVTLETYSTLESAF